jgi:pectate disaccharide-lyase
MRKGSILLAGSSLCTALFLTLAGCGGGTSSADAASPQNLTASSAPAAPTPNPLTGIFTGSKVMSASVTASGVSYSYDSSTGTYTLTGAGKVDTSNAYNYYVIYLDLTGDFTFTARMTAQGSATAERSGIIAVNDVSSATTNWSAAVRYPATGEIRVAKNGNNGNAITSSSGTSLPMYIKMTRTADIITYSYSTDGSTFTNTRQETGIDFNDTIQVGLIASSGSNTTTSTVTFDNVQVTGGSSPTASTDPSASATATATATATASSTPTPSSVPTPNPVPPLETPDPSNPAHVIFIPSGDPATVDQTTALTTAISVLPAGSTLFIPTGTYKIDSQLTIPSTNNGSLIAYKTLASYNGTVTFDFSAQPYGSTSSVSNPRGLQIDGDFWHVYGIEVKGAADNGMFVGGNWNIIEACTFHNNRDSGLQIARSASTLTSMADWPSYNLILNCESYDNYDAPPNGGENADGFACKLTAGPGNVFRGCVSHNNIDDGWDLYTKTETGVIGSVVIEQCVAFSNGTLTTGYQNPAGDKNGFKLGGADISVVHVVTQCVSFLNGKNGFTWNSNPGAIRLVNNTAWDNVEGNFKFDNTSLAIFINNLSFWVSSSGQVSDRAAANSGVIKANNCFWDKSKKGLIGVSGVTSFSSADVQSTAITLPLARNSDGSFNLGTLAKLTSASQLNGTGITPSIAAESGIPDLPTSLAAYFTSGYNVGAK